jgi:hypothetical protein
MAREQVRKTIIRKTESGVALGNSGEILVLSLLDFHLAFTDLIKLVEVMKLVSTTN